ncbi:MAG: hypothetical protein N2Z76_06265 [Treponemataceae bacterium]|nr:hypothetical protein [Treponemataceae bacterium]
MTKKRTVTNPQLRKDPTFLKMVGKAIQQEAARTTTTGETKKESLLKELAELLPQLDEEGLQFLLDQGRIHLYNMNLVELHAVVDEIPESPVRAKKGKISSSRKQKELSPVSEPMFQIKAGSGGGTYHLVYQGKWKVFSDTEMLQMVRIVTEPESSSNSPLEEATKRLFLWFKRERTDVFQDIPFQGPGDPLLTEFVNLLRKTFRIRNSP